MKFLALYYQRIFPNVLDNIYSREKFQFRYTKTERTEASYKAFVEGLFGDSAWQHITIPPPSEQELLLKPYKYCDAWLKHSKFVEEDDNSEMNKFKHSPIYMQLVKDVSQRLGFKFPLKRKQVQLMWDMCRYDLSWQLDRPSAFCTVSSLKSFEILGFVFIAFFARLLLPPKLTLWNMLSILRITTKKGMVLI